MSKYEGARRDNSVSDLVKTSRPSVFELPEANKEIRTGNSQSMARKVSYDALVLDGRLRQSLATVRSLGSRGLRVATLETSDNAGVPAFSSRWCQQRLVCPAHQGTEAYFTYLEQVLEQIRVGVLISSSDGTIALLRRHREHLEGRVRLALAQEPALGIAISKERTLEVARQLGVGVPRAVSVAAVSEVAAALSEIGLPAVVKPVQSWAWDGQHGARIVSQLVTTPEEARRAVEELTRFGGTTLFQEFLSGRRESLSLFYANGEIYARFAFWGKRTTPPLGGLYTLRQAIAWPPDTGEQAERLVREIGLEGYAQVEFRRDALGKPYLMEINPRLNLAIAHAVSAGVDFPYLLYQWASGEPIERVQSYRVGGWMRHLEGDLRATTAAVRQRGRPGVSSPARAVLDFCLSFLVPMKYDYVDWKDLRPAWTATKGFLAPYVQRLLGRRPSV
jgi:predicted ATP-grasp superfamily ATP-dependent carboligase